MTIVSVIIPVYNVEDYLAECLDSVINQTYKELEILCINDCSQDNSMLILKEYEQKDSRIKIFQNEKNSGPAYTRNEGLRKAVGEYVLFVDSDDRIALDLVERCIAVGHGSDLICFDYRQMVETEVFSRQYAYKMKDGLYTGDSFFVEAVYTDSIIFSPWSKLLKRNFLIENNISFYNGILYEDILFSFQCYIKAEKVYSLCRKLYEYRVRRSSIMTTDISVKNIESYIICICELSKLYLQNNFNQKISSAAEGYIRKVSREYISVYRRWGKKKFEPEILKAQPEYLKLYRTFSELFIRPGKLVNIRAEQIERMKQYSIVIMYGAGDIARSTIEILDQYDIGLHGIAVSNADGNKKSLLGNPVRELQYYREVKEKCLVLIATIPRYYRAIRKQLQENGFLQWMEIIETDGEEENDR